MLLKITFASCDHRKCVTTSTDRARPGLYDNNKNNAVFI